MKVLGISALYHDSAACLVADGEIIAAAQEERFSRIKHDSRMPVSAIRYCLKEGRISLKELDYIVYYDNPLLTMDRYLSNILAVGENTEDIIENRFEDIFRGKMWVKKQLEHFFPQLSDIDAPRFLVTKHHISHAASAFFPSPYEKAVIITVDGVGEWTTLSIGIGIENRIEIKEEIRYPHSLGLFYSAFTYFCGFKVNDGDYKFMGLAPYGKPRFYDLICDNIIDIKADGSFRLNMEYFDYQNGRTMINEEKMSRLLEGGRRIPESRITSREMDIAASVQKVTERVLLSVISHAKEVYGKDIPCLCMAGGVALNCVANGKLLRSNVFDKIWIQPAAGDAGGALGAALYAYYFLSKRERRLNPGADSQKGSYLGPQFEMSEIIDYLDSNSIPYHIEENVELCAAELLSQQKVVGYFKGRMEYGPRALGNRSILADPRSETMQSKLNLKIKFRESFRPFAPSVLESALSDYFDTAIPSPYMLFCSYVKPNLRSSFDLEDKLQENDMDMIRVIDCKRSVIPAVTHVDYSARVQTVNCDSNPHFYKLLSYFNEITGCGVLVNTSFNVRGEPIVCTPKDAYLCFMQSDIDVLVLENCILYKTEQPALSEHPDWRRTYELD